MPAPLTASFIPGALCPTFAAWSDAARQRHKAPISCCRRRPTAPLTAKNFPSGTKGLGWGIFSGTSAACPQAAGLVALLKQIDKSLSPAQVKQVLMARSIDILDGATATGQPAGPGPDLATGAGLIDALRACGFAAPIA